MWKTGPGWRQQDTECSIPRDHISPWLFPVSVLLYVPFVPLQPVLSPSQPQCTEISGTMSETNVTSFWVFKCPRTLSSQWERWLTYRKMQKKCYVSYISKSIYSHIMFLVWEFLSQWRDRQQAIPFQVTKSAKQKQERQKTEQNVQRQFSLLSKFLSSEN